MQQAKPQVPPRTSLVKPADSEANLDNKLSNNNKPSLSAKPSVPVKPSIKPKGQELSNHENDVMPNFKPPSLPKPSANKNTSSSTSDKLNFAQTNTTFNKQPLKSIKSQSNKLKISLNELNKLRMKRDVYEPKMVDQKGNYMIYDIREDEEQISKMNEICQLLVAGGYFRARIKGLHNFDKIIGGMCWAIQMCNVDLDIDIFYQESLSIGQKIALTEKIVRVLQKMKCPYKLEPHQIQGMDCIHVFPVIQWLVKKSLETRQQTADYIRVFSSWQYHRNFLHQKELTRSVLMNENHLAKQLVDPIQANLRRRFMHPSREKLCEEGIRVKTTLLEYGVIGTGNSQRVISSGISLQGEPNKSNNSKPSVQNLNETQQKTRSDSDSQSMEGLLKSMTEANENQAGDYVKVSPSVVGLIVNEQSDEIRRLAEDYDRKKSSLTAADLNFLKMEAKLKNEIALIRQELSQLSESDLTEKLDKIKDKLKVLDEKLCEVEESEKNESEEEKAEKRGLSELLGVLRKQKSELKQYCREQKQVLDKQIAQLDEQPTRTSTEEFADKVSEVERELHNYQHRYQSVKRQLALVNKRYARIQRKFDEVPTRTELAQYQKRFLELYNQLSNKHNETKKFYTLYNTLADERSYLEKEFNLINSVLDNFKKAYASNAMVRDEFVVKFEQTVYSIVQNKNKMEQTLQSERNKRDLLNSEYLNLIEKQRLYYVAVKEFTEECKKNEQLLTLLESKHD